jgi:hypothetical protein
MPGSPYLRRNAGEVSRRVRRDHSSPGVHLFQVPEDARKINVLQAAEEITLSNDEDGTAEWLADNRLKETKER